MKLTSSFIGVVPSFAAECTLPAGTENTSPAFRCTVG
jgi:hypothetical protein